MSSYKRTRIIHVFLLSFFLIAISLISSTSLGVAKAPTINDPLAAGLDEIKFLNISQQHHFQPL